MVVARKNIARGKGAARPFDEVRYFFFITDDWVSEAAEVVFAANDRRDREGLLSRPHGGVRALKAPADTLESNWAYVVMTAPAWNLKAWWALALPEPGGRWGEKRCEEKAWVPGLEFKTFVNAFVRPPCQVIRTGGKRVYRLLGWHPYLAIFFRLTAALRC